MGSPQQRFTGGCGKARFEAIGPLVVAGGFKKAAVTISAGDVVEGRGIFLPRPRQGERDAQA